jgi:hypothetical protein
MGKGLNLSRASQQNKAVKRVKALTWLYFGLLITEGAVRKWIPPLSNPFLLIRDPVAILIWAFALQANLGLRKLWGYFYIYAFLVTLWGLLQVIAVQLAVPVFIYGWRTYILHIPVACAAAAVFDSSDLRKLGLWTLRIALPMTALMIVQYLAPSDSWLNKGASEGSSQIGAALGHVRPAGTFSFITGAASFVQFTAAFVMLGLVKRDVFPRWLVVSAGIAVLASMPISGSRTLVLGVAAVVLSAFLGGTISGALSFDVSRVPKIVGGMLAGGVVVVGLLQIPLVKDGITTFSTRWNQAAEAEGSGSGTAAVEYRLTGPFAQVFTVAATAPTMGMGIGLGSNFAASYMGLNSLALGESAWDREVNELGSIAGPFFLALRVWVSIGLAFVAVRALRRHIFLPFYLLPLSVLAIVIGNLDQPTSQGFIIILVFVTLAALKGDPRTGPRVLG